MPLKSFLFTIIGKKPKKDYDKLERMKKEVHIVRLFILVDIFNKLHIYFTG